MPGIGPICWSYCISTYYIYSARSLFSFFCRNIFYFKRSPCKYHQVSLTSPGVSSSPVVLALCCCILALSSNWPCLHFSSLTQTDILLLLYVLRLLNWPLIVLAKAFISWVQGDKVWSWGHFERLFLDRVHCREEHLRSTSEYKKIGNSEVFTLSNHNNAAVLCSRHIKDFAQQQAKLKAGLDRNKPEIPLFSLEKHLF